MRPSTSILISAGSTPGQLGANGHAIGVGHDLEGRRGRSAGEAVDAESSAEDVVDVALETPGVASWTAVTNVNKHVKSSLARKGGQRVVR